jgi:hypothetical protein
MIATIANPSIDEKFWIFYSSDPKIQAPPLSGVNVSDSVVIKIVTPIVAK